MPAQTRCPRCRTVGFVRWEHVISGGESKIHYSCGRCHHAWDVADGQPRQGARKPRVRSEKRDRER